ncbi:MAG TPA: hypothetical protein VK607_20185 [Kofleriaceae bacterium]|nr:hypothetical protein [Kofleriaceae bacterium]HMG53831.1 hypothetical protein [Kofleriaceae bacterium]
MTLSVVPGSNESALRSGLLGSAVPAPVLVGLDAMRPRAGSTGGVGGSVVILVVVGLLLLGLILISAGCGPPN